MPETPSPTTDDTGRLRQPPRLRSIRFGRFRLTYIPDGHVGLKPRGWLPDTTDDDWITNADHLDANGNLVAGLGGLLVQRGRRALLIDAGAGPITQPDNPANPMTGAMISGSLLDNLARVDGLVRIESIAITHLHFDHLGWTLRPAPGNDHRPFHASRIHIGEYEWNWWRSLTPAMIDTFPGWAKGGILNRQVLDTIAGQVHPITHGTKIFPGVRAMIIPGHSTGHTAYVIRSWGRRMIVFGDALHSPVQIAHPDWVSGSDYDQHEAVFHRRRLVERLADSGDLAFGIHFADVPFGHVRRDDDGRIRWVPYD